jgi:predicted membrane channel-forming protein YqfA (hemolysin III family)
MYLIAIAWMYVVLMVAVAEATSTDGTVLGAAFTVLLWGVLPLTVVLYVMGSPARRRARLQAEAAAEAAAEPPPSPPQASAPQGDGGGQPAGDAVAPERKEP